MRERYIQSVIGGTSSLFARISDLFVREPDTDTGLGVYYLVDLVSGGVGGAQVVAIVCENHDIPVYDFRTHDMGSIRDCVRKMMEITPPRCAIIVDMRGNDFMSKVRARIASKHCDLRYKRVIFCLVDAETSSGSSAGCLYVPGSINDRMTMVLYHIPTCIRQQLVSVDCLRPVAESMVDYALFEPRVWREVKVDGTLDEFVSTALYQVVRRVRSDPGVDNDYPSFEREWRRLFATRLNKTLLIPPVALCPSIHRVIPIGVSSLEAMQAMCVAIPRDIQDPYAITVQASAVDERCGSIAITQPMRYTVIHVNCVINPVLLVDVCRELRTGHTAVVAEVHSMNQKLATMEDKHKETNMHLSIIQNEMATLVTRLTKPRKPMANTDDVATKCSKTGCPNLVTTRLRSGKRRKQCGTCQLHVSRTSTKRKSLLQCKEDEVSPGRDPRVHNSTRP